MQPNTPDIISIEFLLGLIVGGIVASLITYLVFRRVKQPSKTITTLQIVGVSLLLLYWTLVGSAILEYSDVAFSFLIGLIAGEPVTEKIFGEKKK